MAKPSARDTILDTAERLFAEHGMDAVSLRTINTEAGYSVAALHYHFGTREGLINALMALREDTILQRRQELLDLLATEEKPNVHQITEALVLPLAEPIIADPENGLRTIKFFFRVYVEHGKYKLAKKITKRSYRTFDQLLEAALPHIDQKTLHQRWVIATELAFQGLANIDNILITQGRLAREKKYRRYTAQLIDFIAGGLAADQGTV